MGGSSQWGSNVKRASDLTPPAAGPEDLGHDQALAHTQATAARWQVQGGAKSGLNGDMLVRRYEFWQFWPQHDLCWTQQVPQDFYRATGRGM